MKVRILGARQGESRDSHFGAILVGEALALDAGSLTSALTLPEQLALRAVFITHHHYDHLKDLATLGFNLMVAERSLPVYCSSEVVSRARATILSDQIWIDFFAGPTPERPTFVHHEVEAGQEIGVEGYRVRALPMQHSVPALGFEVTSSAGETLLYGGDGGPGSGAAWAASDPGLLIAEVTYPDALRAEAADHGHLAPSLLGEELRSFQRARGYLPRVLVVHVNPRFASEVAREVAGVAADLGADLRLAVEGEEVLVGASPG